MNKYWKLIALMIVIVLGIGTFYIYKQMEGSSLPDLVLQKESGDASEGEKVTIQGDYTDGEYTSLQMDITSKGSTYGIGASYFEGYLDPYSDSDMMRSLQKEHRNFMRKKNNESSFYEDDDLIAYADVDIDYLNHEGKEDFTFDVAILNKADNREDTFTVDVPDPGNVDFIYVEDIQVNDGELYIITDNEIFEENNPSTRTEIHVYQFDLSSNELIQDEAIIHIPHKENISVYVGLLPEVNPKGSHDYAVFSHTESKEGWDEDGDPDAESFMDELIAYDFSTNETKTLKLPEEISDSENMYQVFDGSVIYFVDDSDDEVMVSVYDVETEQVDREVTVDVPVGVSEDGDADLDRGASVQIKGDKLYILTGSSMDAHVMVVDMESSDVLYDGVIDVEGKISDGYEIWLYDLMIAE